MSAVTLDFFWDIFHMQNKNLQKAREHRDTWLPGSSRRGKVPDTWFSGSCLSRLSPSLLQVHLFSNFYALLKSNSWARLRFTESILVIEPRDAHIEQVSQVIPSYKAWEVLQQKCFLHYTILSPYESTWYLREVSKPFSNIQLFSKRVLILKFFLFLS